MERNSIAIEVIDESLDKPINILVNRFEPMEEVTKQSFINCSPMVTVDLISFEILVFLSEHNEWFTIPTLSKNLGYTEHEIAIRIAQMRMVGVIQAHNSYNCYKLAGAK